MTRLLDWLGRIGASEIDSNGLMRIPALAHLLRMGVSSDERSHRGVTRKLTALAPRPRGHINRWNI